MNVKKEIERNTEICTRMMICRTACLVTAIPFCIDLLAFLSGSTTGSSQWTLMIILIPLAPMLYYMFRLVSKTNGTPNAIFHVILTALLTPFFLTGPLLIPLLARGDARRLMVVRHTEPAG